MKISNFFLFIISICLVLLVLQNAGVISPFKAHKVDIVAVRGSDRSALPIYGSVDVDNQVGVHVEAWSAGTIEVETDSW